MSKLWRNVGAATVGLGCAVSLSAQTVRGVVVLPDDAPAPGVIVTAVDERGVWVGRALANARGEFVLRLPQGGRVALQLLRIGHRPTIGPTIVVGADAVVTRRLVFTPAPVSLRAVSVNASETCTVGSDTGLAIARVWEEARKAMLSTQLSADDAPLVAEWIEYERDLDSRGRTVLDQRVRTSRHPTTHAFRSQSAAFLADSGYVVADRELATFYVPDVDVLLSDAFASGHCFGLVDSRQAGTDSLIGIGFHPAASRRDLRDIEGTLWLDRQSAELRRLEFAYTNLPAAATAAHAGGAVEFMRLDEGIWIVSRWNVRMPQLVLERPMFPELRRIVVVGTRTALRAVKESGGEVTAVRMRDSVLYQLLGSEILVQVTGGDELIRAEHAVLTLDGTDYVATADGSKRVALSPVLVGRYHARVRTPLMDSLGIAAVEAEVEARSLAHIDTIVLPRARTLLELVVTDTGGKPLPGVSVDVQPSRGS
ncbi:MAG TPA: carboxypeptidase-like regulatory domain-containing protein, partial [Gemmatimonadaceae bacterium]|nr:carboxypeptidase-like regulatory domain-containing protein [Gemmatimonadaceae bacterium]